MCQEWAFKRKAIYTTVMGLVEVFESLNRTETDKNSQRPELNRIESNRCILLHTRISNYFQVRSLSFMSTIIYLFLS